MEDNHIEEALHRINTMTKEQLIAILEKHRIDYVALEEIGDVVSGKE